MSVLLAGSVASAYVVAVVGVHRLNVWRNRAQSGGFPTLRWLDWDTLLEGLLPPRAPAAATEEDQEPVTDPAAPRAPPPRLLLGAVAREEESRRRVLVSVVAGHPADEEVIEASGFSGGQVRWIKTLAHLRTDPERALERLEGGTLSSPGELYLREYLRLTRRTHAVNLEWAVFAAKRRLTQGLSRFGDHPALYFVRALASSLIGFNRAAIDDLARAVYFSRQAPLYLRAVVDTPYIEEARPPLAQQCRLALYGAKKVE